MEEKLGINLRKLRTQKKITLREMADEFGFSYSSLAMYERGERSPDPTTLNRLASFFDVSTDYLLGRTDDPRPFPVEDTRSIDEKWNDPKNEFLYAMYGEVQDLTDEQKEEILNFVDYLKSKADKEKK